MKWLLILLMFPNILMADYFINLDFGENKCEWEKFTTLQNIKAAYEMKYAKYKPVCKVEDLYGGQRITCLSDDTEHAALMVFFGEDNYKCNRAVRKINKVTNKGKK